jgi:hypothetical protein
LGEDGYSVYGICGVYDVLKRLCGNGEKIIDYLKKHENQYCDDCLEVLCDVHPRQQVNQICNKELPNRIETSRDTCFSYGKTKITRRVAKNNGESPICGDAYANIKEQSISVKKLQGIGFEKDGHWLSPSGAVDFELDEKLAGCSNVLYAFIANNAMNNRRASPAVSKISP